MRKGLCALMMTLALTLTGCGAGQEAHRAEECLNQIRSQYLEMTACEGHADITADYGQRVYDFGVDFSWQKEGDTVLTLTAPEMVAGITARIRAGETALEFDGVILETGPLNAAGLSPVDALPALLTYAREGFAAECVLEGEGEEARLRVIFRDPQAQSGQGTEAQLWFVPDSGALARAELAQDGATVLQCTFSRFAITGPDKE